MAITSVTKDGGYLIIVEDGVTKRRSVVYEDAVVSTPPTGYEEVGNIYVNSAGNLVVNYNGSSFEIESGATGDLTGAEIVALLQAMAADDRLEVTYLKDGSTYIKYTAAEKTKLAGVETGATADQTEADIKTLFSWTTSPEDGATADQTGAEIVALLEALTAGNRLSHTKLDDLTTGDPHTQYQQESEKGAASGYASLDASSVVAQDPKVHAARHQTGGADILYVPRTYVWFVPGVLTTGAEKAATFRLKRAATVEDVELHVKTAPTGAALIIDINEGGTTLFNEGDSGVRPEVDIDGYTEDDNHVFTDTALVAGAELTMDIDQIGSTIAGADLTVVLHCKEPII